MESMSTFVFKPIGHMKSLFHFKNGTPRQSSLCPNARGILTIDRSVFNNPDHSLEGLQHYSHAWILFVFHKNNNAHTKAKVKPPRLNGERVGVFSTRSPYRPNNIGLSLVKIDKIEGASIHLSGIDILDGTPVIDIKPYIPEYDKPSVYESPPSPTNRLVDPSKHLTRSEMSPSNEFTDENNHKGPCSSDVVSSKSTHSPFSDSVLSETRTKFMKEGFCSSAGLDEAGATLKHGAKDNPISNDGDNCRQQLPTDGCGVRIDSVDLNIGSVGESPGKNDVLLEGNEGDNNDNDDELLDFLVENVISKAASDVLLTDEVENSNAKSIQSSSASNNLDVSFETTNSREITEMKDIGSNDKSAVTAPWLASPPVTKVRVVFSAESLDQLQNFHSGAADPRYRTEMLSSPEDAKNAITSVLYEDPRSIYRRRKCQNIVYFFVIDVLHVACWFDGNAVTVLRVEPVVDVPHLQRKK